jgi:uncharacterized protein
MPEQLKVGTVGWQDLTVPNAEQVRDFYKAVVGWDSSPVDMGGYSDFTMIAPGTDTPIAGVCHARGENAHVPPQWMLYFIVDDLDRAMRACIDGGGAVLGSPRMLGDARYCTVRDPAGAVCALYQP